MAEQPPTVQNKKLIVIALILATLVTVLFNVYVARAKREGEYKLVKVTVFKKSMKVGDRLRSAGDFKPVLLAEKYLPALPRTVLWDRRSIASEKTLVRPAQAGEILRFNHIELAQDELPSNAIDPTMRSFTFRVDRDKTPGDILLPNSRVDVIGQFSMSGMVRAVPVIKKVRVLTVGGRSSGETHAFATGRRASSSGQRSYRTITIEVPPDVALKLTNIRAHALGDFWVSVLNPRCTPPDKVAVTLEVEHLAGGVRGTAPRSP